MARMREVTISRRLPRPTPHRHLPTLRLRLRPRRTLRLRLLLLRLLLRLQPLPTHPRRGRRPLTLPRPHPPLLLRRLRRRLPRPRTPRLRTLPLRRRLPRPRPRPRSPLIPRLLPWRQGLQRGPNPSAASRTRRNRTAALRPQVRRAPPMRKRPAAAWDLQQSSRQNLLGSVHGPASCLLHRSGDHHATTQHDSQRSTIRNTSKRTVHLHTA